MDLASLKNIDLKDIVTKLKSGGIADKKLLIQFGVGFGAILIFLIGYYFFVSPILEKQEKKINEMKDNNDNISIYSDRIVKLREEVEKLKPEYNKNSKLFHSKKEVEDLYQNISNFAMTNGLSIINIVKGEPKAVGQNENSAEQTENAENNPSVLYYTIPVNYKISGSYLGYLKFRRALSKSNKVINFDKETITIDPVSGKILSEGTISIVGLPNEYKN